MTGRAGRVLALGLALCAAGCPKDKPAAATRDAGSRADASVAHADDAGQPGDAGADAEPTDAGAPPEPDPQIGARPGDDTLVELSARMRHLVEAIAQDNPDLAQDVLFPKDAFAATHDTKDAHRDWTRKVSRPFKKAVSAAHKRAKGSAHARFGEFRLGAPIAQAPTRKGELKVPLWRVKRSRLTLVIDGKTQHLDVAEMTSWRGNWYVTRLR